MTSTQTIKVWITYAFEDKAFVELIENSLRSLDAEILNEELEVLPGDNIVTVMAQSIAKADLILVIISKESSEKRRFSTELSLVVSTVSNDASKRLIPVILDRYVTLPPFISQYQGIYLEKQDNISYELNKIIKTTRRLKEIQELDNIINSSKRELDLHVTKEDIYEFEKQEYEFQRREYEKHITQRQKLVSISFLTAAFTSFIALTVAIYVVYFNSASRTSQVYHSHIDTTNIPYISQIVTILVSVFLSTAVTLFLNRLNKK